jgi:hypothetical protein
MLRVVLLWLCASAASAQIILPTNGSFTYSSSPPASAPAPASAVGYNTQTFNSTTLGTTPGTLQLFNFFSNTVTTPPTQNGDGSLTFTGSGSGNTYNATVSSAAHNGSNTNDWQGIAFGGGFYAEATAEIISGTPPGGAQSASFWFNDVETMGPGAVTPANHWPGQASNFGDWIEVDAFEFNQASLTSLPFAVFNWYGTDGGGLNVNAGSISGSPVTGVSPNFQSLNQYGVLWVPATVSTQGYIKFYFNRVQVGNTIYWNQYNSGTAPPPPTPTSGGNSAFSIIDQRHLAIIFGVSSSAIPMKLTAMQVWQASGANNITQ